MAIDSKNLLVWVKAMSRGQALPLDASEVYASVAEAETYASSSAIAYAGQTIKAMREDGKYHTYTLQPSDSGYVLDEIGGVEQSGLKQYVNVVESLPESGQTEGVLYICDTTGYVWTGSDWRTVFWDVSTDISDISESVAALEEEIKNAVASSSENSIDGEIVVFDSVTGKVIKGSNVQIASLNDAIAKMHEHSNKDVLDSYDKTQVELLAAAKAEAEDVVAAALAIVEF